MRKIIAQSPAKLNLTFDILGELPNGYHRVATLLQAIDLYDKLTFEISHPAPHLVEQASEHNLSITCTNLSGCPGFPEDATNLIAKAAQLFLLSLPEQTAIDLKVTVDKHVPIGAGLAGGSGNAAATLLALNYFFGHPFGAEELLILAGKLGADVPFPLEGGTCIGRSRGDELTAVECKSEMSFCVVKPKNLSISTAWVYSAYDEFQADNSSLSVPDLESATDGLASGDMEKATRSFGNVFEPVVFFHYPELAELKQTLLALGSWCCHLTGSGPTLFSVVPDLEMAHFIRRKITDNENLECHITSSIRHGAQLTGEYAVS